MVSGQNTRAAEYFECEEGNSPFWDAVNKAKITSTKDTGTTNLFKSFLEYNNLSELDPTHIRVFFNNFLPICFCFIKENEKKPIDAETIKKLNDAFDYLEPIISKLHKKISRKIKIFSL